MGNLDFSEGWLKKTCHGILGVAGGHNQTDRGKPTFRRPRRAVSH